MLTALPQVWGERTDVHESADWYNSMYIIVWGTNIAMTRTPDAHFLSRLGIGVLRSLSSPAITRT